MRETKQVQVREDYVHLNISKINTVKNIYTFKEGYNGINANDSWIISDLKKKE